MTQRGEGLDQAVWGCWGEKGVCRAVSPWSFNLGNTQAPQTLAVQQQYIFRKFAKALLRRVVN